MHTVMPNAGRPAYYTVRASAWVLGVETSKISRAIRVGQLPAVRRRGRLLVPASALTRLLGEPAPDGSRSGGAA